ncbi:MAG: hypothetical protein ACRDTU_06740 [Micromonosporaceae bacterium]
MTLVLLGSLPGFFLIRYATRDPGFRAMDGLAVPTWAARNPADEAVGSRWCIRTCRVRQRLWESERAIEPTSGAYQKALRDAGWKRWDVADCPVRNVRGHYSCWRRDAYTMDMWIRAPQCRRNGGGGSAESGSGNRCPASLVTVVIRNAGADYRLK